MSIFIAPEIWPASLMISILVETGTPTLAHNILSLSVYYINSQLVRASRVHSYGARQIRVLEWSCIAQQRARELNLRKVTLQQRTRSNGVACVLADRVRCKKSAQPLFTHSHTCSAECE